MLTFALISSDLLFFVSCNKPNNQPNQIVVAPPDNQNLPIEIPFIEYSLDCEKTCYWHNFDVDTIIIINSNEELQNYIDCGGGRHLS